MGRAKHIGIVGCSAEGAALCYRTICIEGAQILGPHQHPEVTMHTFPLGEYLRSLKAQGWEANGRLMSGSARILADAGADLLICPDNTVHQALDLIRDDSPLPWLHIAEEVAAVAAERGLTRLGVIGTRWLMEGPVYPPKLSARGMAHEIPDLQTRERIDAIIFDELVYGRFEEASRAFLQGAIGGLKERGCDGVVLGCTEIPLIIRGDADSPLPVLDSTRILARAALREATRS